MTSQGNPNGVNGANGRGFQLTLPGLPDTLTSTVKVKGSLHCRGGEDYKDGCYRAEPAFWLL